MKYLGLWSYELYHRAEGAMRVIPCFPANVCSRRYVTRLRPMRVCALGSSAPPHPTVLGFCTKYIKGLGSRCYSISR